MDAHPARATRAPFPFRGRAIAYASLLGGGNARTACSTSPRARGEVGFRAKRRNPGDARGWGLRGEAERVDTPPNPICFASQGLRSQIDLSPRAGRGGASGFAESQAMTVLR